MKIVPYRALDSSAWDDAADHSGEAWLFHRWAWVAVETRFAALANCSFALVDEKEKIIGLQPLYRRDQDRGWLERVLDSGYHRQTGLALRDDLAADVRQAALKMAMPRSGKQNTEVPLGRYSTVTDFARFRGWSTSHPRRTAM